MAHYLVFSMNISDFARWQSEYVPAVGPLLLRHQGAIVAVQDHPAPLAGQPRNHNVILRFPDEARALAWHQDPDYAPLKAIRDEIATDVVSFGAASWVAPVPDLLPLQADRSEP